MLVKKRPRQIMPEWKRIVIFRQGQFGDTIVVFPVIEALNELFPGAQIVYCTNYFRTKQYVQGCDVARLSPFIQRVVTYIVEDSVVKKYLDLRKSLKPAKNDLLIYLPYNTVRRYQVIRDWLFFKLLNFKNIICFKETWDWIYFLKNKNKIMPKESERMVNIIRSAGIPIELKEENCTINYDKTYADKKWIEWELGSKKVLAICPGSKRQSTRWSKQRYIKLGKMLHELANISLVVIGGPEEAELANDIVSQWQGYGFSCCGASISQTAGILKKTVAYCGNDTGSTHLAATLGVPCVAIFSARQPANLWYPSGDKNIVLRKDVDCKYCYLEQCHSNPPLCLEKITVEEVLEALVSILRQKEVKIK